MGIDDPVGDWLIANRDVLRPLGFAAIAAMLGVIAWLAWKDRARKEPPA